MKNKNALVNIISTFMLQIVTIICGFIVPRLILKNFGSAANGLVSSITQFLSYISLIDGGFGVVIKAALYKPIAENNRDEVSKILKTSEHIFKKISYFFIIYVVLLVFIFPIINNEFSFTYIFFMIIVLSLATFIEYFFGITYRIFLTAKQQIYISSFIQIVLYIINTLIVLLLINCGANIQVVKLASSLIFIVRPIILYIYVKQKYKLNFKNSEIDKNSISQRWNGMIQHIASVIHSNTDIAIITIFSTLTEVSVYSVYLFIMNGIKNLITSISTGIEATFGELIAKNEISKLNNNFRIYEFIQYNIITIIFTSTAVLILPFVNLYTNGINDTNYIRPTFAYVFIITQVISCIKVMYNSLALTAGKIKETRTGALIEALINIILSIILIKPFGIVGIIFATLISVSIRCIELIIFVSKNILKRSLKALLNKFLASVLSPTISILIFKTFFNISINSYFNWIIYAIIVFVLNCIITLIMNLILNFNDCKYFINKLKKIVFEI